MITDVSEFSNGGLAKMKGVTLKGRLSQIVLLTILSLTFMALPAMAKHKDDVVVLKNGDRLTGEIKSLERGELRFKASYMVDAVRLEWAAVERLESKDKYIISLTSGLYVTGGVALSPTGAGGEGFVIETGQTPLQVKQLDVLRIQPAESSFLKQLQGTIDYGFNYTSGNDQYQSQLSASVSYSKDNHSVAVQGSSVFGGQSNANRTQRNNFSIDYRKQFLPRWAVGGMLDLLESSQQSLNLRTTAGAGIARNFIQTDKTSLWALGGAVVTHERYAPSTGRDPRETNVEGMVGLNFMAFRFRTVDVSARYLVNPSFTQPGRVRMALNSNTRIKLVKNLYWSFNVYENFDSRPPLDARKNDLGVSTSFGWKFGNR
jgi:hypothetical protein